MDRLGTFYSDLHWKYSGWWAKLLLFILALLRFIPEIVVFGIVSALVSLASTMYSIAGSMRAAFKAWVEIEDEDGDSMWLEATMGFLIFLLPLGLPSVIVAFASAFLAALFGPILSANQCDVVSTIFARIGFRRTAFAVARLGLSKSSSLHTKAFLNLTRARTSGSLKSPDLGPLLAEAMDIASRLRYSSSVHEQRQAARIYSQIAEIFDWVGNDQRAESARAMARSINLKLGLGDQLLKHP